MKAALRRALAVSVGLGAGACGAGGNQRSWYYMPDMVHSIAYDTFAPNPVTRDGKTLQKPVAGTIPRGFLPFHYKATPEDAERAGRELVPPFAFDDRVRAEGKALFATFCVVCHGVQGHGDGPLVPKIPNPPSYTSERVRKMAPGQIFHVITLGSGRMPPYASQVSPEERWKIAAYVQTLQARGGSR
jgi:mono/diheme cytochrome c family protein